jgi:protein-S-isoprenylcysteine O-methyltransferase Ste14
MPPEITTARLVARLGVSFLIVSALLFGSAGTLNWPEAWLYVTLQFSFSAALSAWLKANNPELLRERMTFLKPSARSWDKVIVIMGTAASIPLLGLAGLDAVRYRWSQVPVVVEFAGLAGIIASCAIIFRVMRQNPYLSRVVEIQKHRNHRVIATGPYRYIRHPMYLGVIMYSFSIPVALGSLWSLIPATLIAILIVIRTHLEDKTLREELDGYEAYARHTRYRLVPGLW